MVEVKVDSGICGFQTTVRAGRQAGYTVNLQVESNCPNVAKLAAGLDVVNAMQELFKKGESQVLSLANRELPHCTCPAPIGILKAVEAAAGLALPRDSNICFVSKED